MSFRPEDLPEGAINTKEIDGLWKYFSSVSLDDTEGGILLTAFILQLDWREHWIQGLEAFHLATSVVIFLTRGRLTLQAVIFCVLCTSITP